MGREMAALDAEAADRCEHVQGVLSNRVVGVVGQWHRFVRGAAAAPVDSDDPEVVRNQWPDEVKPHAAREIPVDEHHRFARPPLRVVQPDVADINEHHSLRLPLGYLGCDNKRGYTDGGADGSDAERAGEAAGDCVSRSKSMTE